MREDSLRKQSPSWTPCRCCWRLSSRVVCLIFFLPLCSVRPPCILYGFRTHEMYLGVRNERDFRHPVQSLAWTTTWRARKSQLLKKRSQYSPQDAQKYSGRKRSGLLWKAQGLAVIAPASATCRWSTYRHKAGEWRVGK